MFKLLRYFSIVSFAAIIITTIILVVLTRHTAVNQLMELTTQQNIGLARSFANALWLGFEPYFTRAANDPEQILNADTETDEIFKDLKMLTGGLSVVSAKIYNPYGVTIFSPESHQIGKKVIDQHSFSIASQETASTSVFSHREQMLGFSGLLMQRDLIETYVPIHDADGAVSAVIHLHTDVTAQMQQIEQTQTNLIKALLLSSVLLYGVLFFIVRRADTLLHSQHKHILHKEETIWRKNRQLEQEANQRTQIEQALQEAQQTLDSDARRHTHHGYHNNIKRVIDRVYI